MLETAKFDQDQMYGAAGGGFTNATDVADYLVRKGLPFREAHAVVGQAVMYCEKQKKTLEEVSLTEWQQFDARIEQDIYDAISMEACVFRRSVPGGPAPEAVTQTIEQASDRLNTARKT